MARAVMLSFREGVVLVGGSDEQVTLEAPRGNVTLSDLTPGLLAALRALASGGATEDALSDLVLETDGAPALAPLYYHLQRYGELGLLRYTLVADGQALATVEPMTRGFQLRTERVGVDARFRLSRFAYCRRDGDALVLESPLSPARTILPGRTGAALVAELAQPRSARDLCASMDGLTADMAEAFLALLASVGMVATTDDDGALAEDRNATLMQWEFHDLLFHSRSRLGRHDYPFGGTFRFLGQLPPLPALKPRLSDDVVPLYQPDLDRLEQEDLPLTRALEARRSIRAYGDPPITARQLGEFLYRVARVRQLVEPDPARGLHYEASRRVYPSGGATYDLELYPIVNTCVDLPSGLYHYDPGEHQLCQLADSNPHVQALLRDAQHSAGLSQPPQVLITLASRFQRLSWKYAAMAYATTLKNVGVLYQTMYLVATAMGLAPCALGGGDADRFAAAAGTDYYAESSVGEFLLGSRPPG